MMLKDLLDLPVRKRIFEHIRANPGLHFRGISRDLEVAVGQLDFHINAMIKAEMITSEHVDGHVRYYVRDSFSRDEKKALSILRREIPRGIVLYLIEHPGSNPSRILESFSFTSATLSYHLRRLEGMGILRAETVGRERFYHVAEPDLMGTLLVMYKTSIFDRIIDSVL
ncbi:MAG: hypothetical protein QCI82_06395 [Candidatus Thermoplasmatota archaeon]|nr:hypothetical protein [Candidatus Thermoplasmatota archaeon]